MADGVAVSVPATSANLGPGYDCLAVALELRNRVEVRHAGGARVVVQASGEGAAALPRDAANLVVRAFAAAGGDPAGLEFRLASAIPLARGLGSSAAAIVAGVTAALTWTGEAVDERALGVAAAVEGHADNVAAALLGGLTAVVTGAVGPRALRLSDRAHETVGFVLVVPPDEVSTSLARAALPTHVPHADAAHNVGRAAMLVAALGEGRLDAVAAALDDRLHEPYRMPLSPLLEAVRARLGALPAVGATLSGAGPSVLVWCQPGGEAAVAAALDGMSGARATTARVASEGARVEAA